MAEVAPALTFGYARDPDTGGPGAVFFSTEDGSWCELSHHQRRDQMYPEPEWSAPSGMFVVEQPALDRQAPAEAAQ